MRRVNEKQCKYKLRPCTVKPLSEFRMRTGASYNQRRSWCRDCENYHSKKKRQERTERFKKLNLIELLEQQIPIIN